MKKYIQHLTLGVILAVSSPLFFGGCASGVTRPAAAQAGGYKLSEERKAGAVSVSLSDAAKEKLKDNLKFDHEALRKHVEKALEASSVLDIAKREELPRIEIVVTDMRVRSNFSAVMWGAMAGADSIKGDIVMKDLTGKELDRFHVSASYALGGLAGGQDSARMDWLYEAFAKETLKELTGKK
jgi:hypothetical protein